MQADIEYRDSDTFHKVRYLSTILMEGTHHVPNVECDAMSVSLTLRSIDNRSMCQQMSRDNDR